MAASSTHKLSALRRQRTSTLSAPLTQATPPPQTNVERASFIINELAPFLVRGNADLRQLAEKGVFFGKLCAELAQALEQGVPWVIVDYDNRWGELPALSPPAGFEIRCITLHEQAAGQGFQGIGAEPSGLTAQGSPARMALLPRHLASLPVGVGLRINKLYSLAGHDPQKLNFAAFALVDVIANRIPDNPLDEMTLAERAQCLNALEVTVREIASTSGEGTTPVGPLLERIAKALRGNELEVRRRDVLPLVRRIKGLIAGLEPLRTCATPDLPHALENCGKTARVIFRSDYSPLVKTELLRRLVREMNYMAYLPSASKREEVQRRKLVGDAFAGFIMPNVPPLDALPPGAVARRLHEEMERQLQVAGVYAQAHGHG
ncbi:hypothetical protein BH11PSE7_BH11PSE7_04540 [soil metagenome]